MDAEVLSVELEHLAALVHRLDSGSWLQLHLVIVDAIERATSTTGTAAPTIMVDSEPLVALDRRTPAPERTPVAAEATGPDVPRPQSPGADPCSPATGDRP